MSCLPVNGSAVLSISPPMAGEPRTRKVISRSRARPTGKYPSWKLGRMTHWESVNELNAHRLLDANPAVKAFSEQPFVIRYLVGEEQHIHFPDLLVEFAGYREIWEVKPQAEAVKPEVLQRTAILSEALPAWGYRYRVVLGEDLAREPRLSNALTLLKHGRNEVSLVHREHLRLLFQTGPLAWACFSSGEHRRLLAPVCRLILEGRIHLGVDAEFSKENLLFWLDGA